MYFGASTAPRTFIFFTVNTFIYHFHLLIRCAGAEGRWIMHVFFLLTVCTVSVVHFHFHFDKKHTAGSQSPVNSLIGSLPKRSSVGYLVILSHMNLSQGNIQRLCSVVDAYLGWLVTASGRNLRLPQRETVPAHSPRCGDCIMKKVPPRLAHPRDTTSNQSITGGVRLRQFNLHISGVAVWSCSDR